MEDGLEGLRAVWRCASIAAAGVLSTLGCAIRQLRGSNGPSSQRWHRIESPLIALTSGNGLSLTPSGLLRIAWRGRYLL